nr:MAG TPA: head tail adaptor [Caudoviricetes sp.]
MNRIGGNTTAIIQINTGTTKDATGSRVKTWETVDTLTGFIDLQAGDSRYTSYNAKIQESTHIFVADYKELDGRIKAENSRILIDGATYDVKVIDDPMNLHKQVEIYLVYTGGQ